MSYPDRQGFPKDSGLDEAPSPAEATLRLIARLPAPQGLEDRVQASLRNAPRPARVLAWPVSLSTGWLRAAAAAAIVFVVAGGGWGIYSRVQPGHSPRGAAGPGVTAPRLAAPGGFTEGGVVRRPQTLIGPIVAPAVTHPATAVAPKPKTLAKPATTMPVTKSTAVARSVTPPVAPAVQ
jgi:hypothetical protein